VDWAGIVNFPIPIFLFNCSQIQTALMCHTHSFWDFRFCGDGSWCMVAAVVVARLEDGVHCLRNHLFYFHLQRKEFSMKMKVKWHCYGDQSDFFSIIGKPSTPPVSPQWR